MREQVDEKNRQQQLAGDEMATVAAREFDRHEREVSEHDACADPHCHHNRPRPEGVWF